MYKKNINSKINKGYALLVSIVTTSLLLIVSFAVVNVALKQLILSSSNQESQYSYYNAESGIECAVYWDLKNPLGTSAFATDTPPTSISCNGSNVTEVTPIGGGGDARATSTFMIQNLTPKGCVVVNVAKVPTPASSYGLTRVEAYGYNLDCSATSIRKFERGVSITY